MILFDLFFTVREFQLGEEDLEDDFYFYDEYGREYFVSLCAHF